MSKNTSRKSKKRASVKGKKRYSAKRKKRPSVAKKIILITLASITGLAIIFAGLAWGAYMGIIGRAPDINHILAMINEDNNFTTVIIDWKGDEIDRLNGGEIREYVDFWRIPDNMKNAVIAIEDERFFEHDGVDIRGMLRAVRVFLRTRRTEGASTITQQVIKNKLGYMRNEMETKLQEQVLALELEQLLTEELGSKIRAKEYILNVYLNLLPLGHGQIGVQAAALNYFNKNVWELTLSECAAIAAITSNPTRYSPIRNPERNAQRRKSVLDNMLRLGHITQEEYDEALADNVYDRVAEAVHEASLQPSTHNYFVDHLIDAVINDLMAEYELTREEASEWVYFRGLTIISTIDDSIQAIVDAAYLNESLFPQREFEVEVEYRATIRNENTQLTRNYNNSSDKGIVQSLDDINGYVESLKETILEEGDVIVGERVIHVLQPQSAIAVTDITNGHVVAIAGGRGEKLINRGLNRAIVNRQPGSTFKTFVFAAALDMRIATAATVIDDVPRYELVNGVLTEWPRNWDRGWRGLTSARTSLVQSMNINTVKLLEQTGLANVINYIENLGISSLVNEDRNLGSIALGGLTYGVSPVELTAAYGAIANQGVYNEPVFYTRVLDHYDNIILDNVPEPRQVMRRTSAYILTDMMADVIKSGTGQRARFSNAVTIPAAGKTGTTSETRDLWFAGYTPYYAASVWIGYDQRRNLSNSTSSERTHLRLWSHIMEEIHKTLPHKDFPMPDGLERVNICSQSGLLPITGLCDNEYFRGSQLRQEIFETATVPVDYCNVHETFEVCVGINGATDMKLPGYLCPEDHIAVLVGIVRPEPYLGDRTINDQPYEKPREYCAVHSPYSGSIIYIPYENDSPLTDESDDIDE